MKMSGVYILVKGFLYNIMSVNIFDDLINSVLNCFNRAFDFESRSSRKEFWYWQIFRILMFLSFTYIESLGVRGVLIISNIIFLIPEVSVTIRRLHDINKSGLWVLLSFTIIGILPLFYFYCLKGDQGTNDFGLPK